MKTNKFKIVIPIAICLFVFGCSLNQSDRKTIDLSGEWSFKLDSGNVGGRQEWFNQSFEESVILPGTTDENQKGHKNDKIEINTLTRKYIYVGKAWYKREVNIPANWKEKTIQLFLERTKATEVWVDGRHFSSKKNLQTPHVYDLTEVLSPGLHTLTISVDNNPKLFPTGGTHALSEHTQTNWNGIIGKMELRSSDRVFIQSTKLYPDIVNGEVKIVLQIVNPNHENLKGEIECEANGFNGNSHNAPKQTFEFSSEESEIEITKTYKMGDFAKWDEYTPNLYKLTASLNAKSDKNSFQHKIEETFGMVEFSTKGTQFEVNGKVTFLRGKNDACVFPLTGYPPMNKDEWIRQMEISKSYGINHYRFHTWTPPKAAFEAADIVGIYMQPELPSWRSFDAADTAHYNFQKHEGELIFDNYANHPSFVLFSLGNELGGDRGEMAKMVSGFKQYETRILFAQGSNNYFWDPQVQPGEDFFVSARTRKREGNFDYDIRASFSFADCPEGGILNGEFPNTETTFSKALQLSSVPAIGHETGQYQSLPNYAEIPKYKGVLEARNFEVFKQRMIDQKLFPYWKELFMASGKLAALCYKADNEMSLRTPGFGGFQILDLQDFPGQGTALVGILDAFMDSKGFIMPEEWRQSCDAQTVQAKMAKYVWQNNEDFQAELIAINYGESDIVNDAVQWALTDEKGEIFSSGKTDLATFKQGKITSAGAISVSLSAIKQPKNLIFSLSIKNGAVSNQYNIWIYPVIEKLHKNADILIASVLDKNVLAELKSGKKVLLIPEPATLAQNSVGGLFTSDYWCYPMFKGICEGIKKPVSPGTLGLLIDKQHPVFNNFPTGAYSDWQWWSIVKKSYPIILDSTDVSYRPIVQVVDNFERCSKLGLLFEFAVGEGKLLVCSSDLSDGSDYVAQTLLKSMLDYLQSDKFAPATQLTQEKLLSLIYGSSESKLKSRKTNEDGNTSGYKLLE